MILSVFTLSSCSKSEVVKDDNGRITHVQEEWKFNLHKSGQQFSNSILRANLVNDGTVVLATTDTNGERKLSGVDVSSGEELWRWSDELYRDSRIDIKYCYIYDDILHYIEGANFYFIDLQNGTTYKKLIKDHSYWEEEINGFGPTYYFEGHPVDTFQEYVTYTVLKSNFHDNKIEKVLLPPLDLSEIVPPRIGRVGYSKPFIRDRDTFVSLTYQQIHKDIKFSSYLGLYNDTQDEWVYDSIQLNEPDIYGVVYGPIKIYESKVYVNQRRNILCHDLMTGELIWKRPFPRDFRFSGFIVKEGVVVANCENSVLYGLDANTGKTLWEGMGAGTSSYLNDRYLNGIVYFSGGSTSHIHAVDIHTGETVWLLEAGKYDEEADDFKPDIYVVPGEGGEKGKVVVCTHLDAYCLTAYR